MSVPFLPTTAASVAHLLLTFVIGSAYAQESPLTMQVSPEGGGHCIEVADRKVAQDQRLQMADCTNAPAQMFAYDRGNMRLTIAGLCVDANGGQPGDLVKLSICRGDATQTWKLDQKGNFAKFVGTNGLCLDIRYGSTQVGALVQSWTCADTAPNQLWRFQHG